jgi:hypothetical protein
MDVLLQRVFTFSPREILLGETICTCQPKAERSCTQELCCDLGHVMAQAFSHRL